MEFEKKLQRLEEIVVKMEKGDLALESSLTLFEEGIKISRECNSQLTDAENKVKILMSVGADGKPNLKEFEPEEN